MKKDFFKKDPLLRLDSSPHSPHQIIQELVKIREPLILDVGCNSGYLGKELIEHKKALVDGIDINPEALQIAKQNYRKVFLRDLSDPKMNIEPEQYDYIIFSDILEHVARPDLILMDALKYLKQDGRLIISLPNIARFEIRLNLMLGNFDYNPGILGEDHLRFFTKESASRMIHYCGFRIEKVIPTGLGHKVGVFPNLTAFQFIFVCKSL